MPDNNTGKFYRTAQFWIYIIILITGIVSTYTITTTKADLQICQLQKEVQKINGWPEITNQNCKDITDLKLENKELRSKIFSELTEIKERLARIETKLEK